MTEETKTRRSHTRLWIGAAIGVGLLAIVGAIAWYLQSPRFEDVVRRTVISKLEDATGGRVDLRSFHWNLKKLEFEANDLTIHGREGPDQLPYVHADRAYVRLRILSFVQVRVNLKYLGLEHPVIHLIVYPDGTTNAPEPKVKQSNATPVQRLFDLAITRADLQNGMLLLNDRELPLDFSADDIVATMTYDRGEHRYDGNVRVGKMDVKYQDFRDVPAQAEMQFSLWHDAAQINSLKLTSEKSSLQAQGKLTNFDDPRIEFSYSSTLDIGQLGAIARVYEIRGGTLTLGGSGTYSEANYASRGKLAIRGFDYLQEGVVLHNASASADFSLDKHRLSLTRIAGRLLGGELAGDAEVRNLFLTASSGATPAPSKPVQAAAKRCAKSGETLESPSSTTAKISGPGPQQGSARLRVSGVSLAELAGALSTKSLPFEKLNPVGRMGGTVDLAWTRSLADAHADLALDIVPPAQPGAGGLPVSANLHGRYSARPQVMDLSAFNLMTPHTHLNASGTLGKTSADLKVVFNATSLTELQPFVTALGYVPMTIELAGEANFSGTVSGRPADSRIVGHLEASNFTYIYAPLPKTSEHPVHPPPKKDSFFHAAPPAPGEPPLQQAAQARRIHIDQLSGDVQYSQSEVALHHAIIQEGSAHFNVDWTAALDKGSFTEDSPFQLQATVHNADVAELQRAAGLNYPVSGTLNLTMEAAGTETNPHGQGQFSLTAAQIYGRPVKSVGSNLVFANHEAQLKQLRLQAAGGVIAGTAAYNFGNKNLSFDLNGVSLDMAEIPELQTASLRTAGVVRFAAKGSGTIEEPIINAHVQVNNLALNGEPVGGLTADAVTRGRELQLTARSSFPKASFSLEGNVELRGDMPGKMTMQFSNLDIDPLLRTGVKGRITGHSAMAGEATVTGPLKQPRLLSGSFRIDQFSVEVEKIRIASDGRIELSLANGLVSVQRCALVSGDSRFALAGNLSLKNDRRMDLRADGHLDLKLVHTLDPDVTSYGTVNIGITVKGDTTKPRLSGRIEIVHGGLSWIDLPTGLGDINGSLVFNQDRLEVEQLTARTGGGR